MCKKLVLAAVAILVGTAVVRHTSIGSLAQVWWHDAKQAVERQVPPETQIKQLVIEVGKIDRDIKQNLSRLAGMEVETQNLEEAVAAAKENQASLKADITAMTKALDANTERVSINGKSASYVTRKLDRTVDHYKAVTAEIKGKEKLLADKKEALEAAHSRIAAMKSQKEQLRDTVSSLQTRLEVARSEATRNQSGIEFDESQLARCQQLAREINQRLLTDELTVKNYAKYGYGPKPLEAEETKSTAEVLKSAKKAIQDEADQVVEGKK
jgi:chromosome segregation ATPase